MTYIYIWLLISFGVAGGIDYVVAGNKGWFNFTIGFVLSILIVPFCIPMMISLIFFRAMRLTQDK